jgi:hypothetical protein
MAVTSEAFKAASERGRRATAEYGATEAWYDARYSRVCVRLNSGKVLLVSKRAIGALREATDAQLKDVRLTPSRLGLHFELLDQDLSIPNLIHSEDGRDIKVVPDER